MFVEFERECRLMPEISGTVFVVDDDAAVRGALKFALELEGLKVRLFDGPAALLAESSFPSDGCLVIDYRMPNMDGLELISQLRALKVGLPIILITGRVSGDLRRRAVKLGVHRVLEKPLSDGALVEGLQSIFSPPA